MKKLSIFKKFASLFCWKFSHSVGINDYYKNTMTGKRKVKVHLGACASIDKDWLRKND